MGPITATSLPHHRAATALPHLLEHFPRVGPVLGVFHGEEQLGVPDLNLVTLRQHDLGRHLATVEKRAVGALHIQRPKPVVRGFEPDLDVPARSFFVLKLQRQCLIAADDGRLLSQGEKQALLITRADN